MARPRRIERRTEKWYDVSGKKETKFTTLFGEDSLLTGVEKRKLTKEAARELAQYGYVMGLSSELFQAQKPSEREGNKLYIIIKNRDGTMEYRGISGKDTVFGEEKRTIKPEIVERLKNRMLVAGKRLELFEEKGFKERGKNSKKQK